MNFIKIMVKQIDKIDSTCDQSSGEPAIDIRNAVFAYNSGVTILDDLSLKIPKGLL